MSVSRIQRATGDFYHARPTASRKNCRAAPGSAAFRQSAGVKREVRLWTGDERSRDVTACTSHFTEMSRLTDDIKRSLHETRRDLVTGKDADEAKWRANALLAGG